MYSCSPLKHTIKLYLIFPSSPPGKRESLYLTEGGREAFDQLYRLWEGQMRVVSTSTPSPVLPLPQDSQTQLVSDLLNVLIGVASTTFPLNQVCCLLFVYEALSCSEIQLICWVGVHQIQMGRCRQPNQWRLCA